MEYWILHALEEIVSTQQKSVAILPEKNLGPGAWGSNLKFLTPKRDIHCGWVVSVDYAVIEYENVQDIHSRVSQIIKHCCSRDDFTAFSDYLLEPRHDAFHFANASTRNSRPVVAYSWLRPNAKICWGNWNLIFRKAVGHWQAIALLESEKFVNLACFTSSSEKIAFQVQSSNGPGPALSIWWAETGPGSC